MYFFAISLESLWGKWKVDSVVQQRWLNCCFIRCCFISVTPKHCCHLHRKSKIFEENSMRCNYSVSHQLPHPLLTKSDFFSRPSKPLKLKGQGKKTAVVEGKVLYLLICAGALNYCWGDVNRVGSFNIDVWFFFNVRKTGKEWFMGVEGESGNLKGWGCPVWVMCFRAFYCGKLCVCVCVCVCVVWPCYFWELTFECPLVL